MVLRGGGCEPHEELEVAQANFQQWQVGEKAFTWGVQPRSVMV